MKREEEIQQKSREEAWYIADTSQTKEEAAIRGYCLGVAYADSTMLDRACEWMNKVFFQNPFLTKKGIVSGKYDTMEEFIAAFRQAMEGGAE